MKSEKERESSRGRENHYIPLSHSFMNEKERKRKKIQIARGLSKVLIFAKKLSQCVTFDEVDTILVVLRKATGYLSDLRQFVHEGVYPFVVRKERLDGDDVGNRCRGVRRRRFRPENEANLNGHDGAQTTDE